MPQTNKKELYSDRFWGLRFLRRLEVFDVPLLMEHVDLNRNTWIEKWVASFDDHSRWMLTKVPKDLLNKYMRCELPMYDLLTHNDTCFILDFYPENPHNSTVIEMNVSELPDGALPKCDEILHCRTLEPEFDEETGECPHCDKCEECGGPADLDGTDRVQCDCGTTVCSACCLSHEGESYCEVCFKSFQVEEN